MSKTELIEVIMNYIEEHGVKEFFDIVALIFSNDK